MQFSRFSFPEVVRVFEAYDISEYVPPTGCDCGPAMLASDPGL